MVINKGDFVKIFRAENICGEEAFRIATYAAFSRVLTHAQFNNTQVDDSKKFNNAYGVVVGVSGAPRLSDELYYFVECDDNTIYIFKRKDLVRQKRTDFNFSLCGFNDDKDIILHDVENYIREKYNPSDIASTYTVKNKPNVFSMPEEESTRFLCVLYISAIVDLEQFNNTCRSQVYFTTSESLECLYLLNGKCLVKTDDGKLYIIRENDLIKVED